MPQRLIWKWKTYTRRDPLTDRLEAFEYGVFELADVEPDFDPTRYNDDDDSKDDNDDKDSKDPKRKVAKVERPES